MTTRDRAPEPPSRKRPETAAPAPVAAPVQRQPARGGRVPVDELGAALGADAAQLGTLDRALVQLRSAVAAVAGQDPARTHAAAARGVAAGGGGLPHGERIQAAFGAHDVSHVRAHVGGAARDAAQEIGAAAYATGDRVAFAAPPDLHTAAHEAAHVVQQQAGVQLAGGVGRSGDPYERHADAVADAVVAGRSAEALLGAGPGGGGAAGPAIQRQEDTLGAASEAFADGAQVVGSVDLANATVVFIDLLVANRGNEVLASAFLHADDFLRSGLPAAAQSASDVAGKVAGAVGMLNELLDMANNGLNFQNGANFVVGAAGTFGGPLLGAFSTGYAVGQFVDGLLGVSDWIASFAAPGDAAVNLALAQVVGDLAARGDRQCAALQRDWELLAAYENEGSRRVNERGGDAAAWSADARGVEGRGELVSARADEILAESEGQSRLGAVSLASRELPSQFVLRERIAAQEEALRRRIEELRRLQAGEQAIWASLARQDAARVERESRAAGAAARRSEGGTRRGAGGVEVATPATAYQAGPGRGPVE